MTFDFINVSAIGKKDRPKRARQHPHQKEKQGTPRQLQKYARVIAETDRCHRTNLSNATSGNIYPVSYFSQETIIHRTVLEIRT